jgi:glycine cleavage system aminomethyltransferase T
LWERILDAGAPFGLTVTGPSDANRVEAGILAYRSDMDLGTNPYELGLGWLVDLDAPADFIGKTALARIRREGVTRSLVGIEILGDSPPAPFTERWGVTAGGEPAGYVTVAVHSPRLERTIGYAMVEVAHASPGTGLVVQTGSGEAEATVTKLPFIPPARG